MKIIQKIRNLPLKWRRIIFLILISILGIIISFTWIKKVLKPTFIEIKGAKEEIKKQIKGPSLGEKLKEEIEHFRLLLPRFPRIKKP